MSRGDSYPVLRLGIMQDWCAGAVRHLDGKCLSPLRQGEIAVVALLHGDHALTNLVRMELFCIRADYDHIPSQEWEHGGVSERDRKGFSGGVVERSSCL